MLDIKQCGEEILDGIKTANWFPYKTGNLRNNATTGKMISNDIYLINFDSTIAPYLIYLEQGKKKYLQAKIAPRRYIEGFGTNFVGVSNPQPNLGFYYAGKHMGFISDKTINYILDYFKKEFGGVVEK